MSKWWFTKTLLTTQIVDQIWSMGSSSLTCFKYLTSLVAQIVKNSACNARDMGSIPGSGRSPGEGNGYSVQYSCLENSMDRGQSLGLQSVRLTDYSPWGCKVSDTTEWLTLTFQNRSRINFFFIILTLVGWHHQLNGHEFEQTLGDGEGQRSLVCCSPRGHKGSATTVRLNNKSWLCR